MTKHHTPKRSRRPRETKIADWGFDEDRTGPWFIASYESVLSCCGNECEEGDEIRADGEGGWEGRCCYPGDDD